MSNKDTSSRESKADYLYVKPKSLPRELIQKIFLKLLQILFPKKFLFYRNKIRTFMNKFRNYLFFISKNIYLRFKYPRYFTLPIQHIHSIDTLLIFLEILKPKKIDFFLLYGATCKNDYDKADKLKIKSLNRKERIKFEKKELVKRLIKLNKI